MINRGDHYSALSKGGITDRRISHETNAFINRKASTCSQSDIGKPKSRNQNGNIFSLNCLDKLQNILNIGNKFMNFSSGMVS